MHVWVSTGLVCVCVCVRFVCVQRRERVAQQNRFCRVCKSWTCMYVCMKVGLVCMCVYESVCVCVSVCV